MTLFVFSSNSLRKLLLSLRKKVFISATEVCGRLHDLPVLDFNADYGFAPLTAEDVEKMREEHFSEFGNSSYHTMRKNVDSQKNNIKSFGIWFKGKLAGYTNLTLAEIYESNTGHTVPQKKGNLYLFKTFIFKRFRQNDLHLFQTYKRCLWGLENNCKTATGIIQDGNIGSIKVYRKLNFKKSIRIYCIKLFGFKIRFYKKVSGNL